MFRSASAGQRRTMDFRRGSAAAAPLTTLRSRSPRQERHCQLMEQVGCIPWHQVLAAIGEMQIELRVALLQQRGALLSAGAIIASIDQEQRLLQFDQALPQRHRWFDAAIFRRCCMAAYELFEAAPDAVLMTQHKLLLGDELMME